MRLFIAIDIDSQFEKLQKIQEKLFSSQFRMTYPKNFHLTLKFLGDVDENQIPKIIKALNEIDFEKFSFEINSTGYFSVGKQIKVVWIGLEPVETVNKLQKQIEKKLAFGFSQDKKYHPHITIARVKFAKFDELSKTVKNLEFDNINFKVDEIKLLKSDLTPLGPIYETLHKIKLG